MVKSSGFHESGFPEGHSGRGEQSAERFPVRFRTPQFGIDLILGDRRLRLALIFSPFDCLRTDYVRICLQFRNPVHFREIRWKQVIIIMHKDSIFAVCEGNRPVEIPDKSEVPVIPIINYAGIGQ